MVGQIFRDLGGEEARMRVGESIELSVHLGDDVGVLVPEARNGCSTGRVDILLARAVAKEDAVARFGPRIGMSDGSVKDVSHLRQAFIAFVEAPGIRSAVHRATW
jgi:hypothetical protein